jgi:hypothetical protein
MHAYIYGCVMSWLQDVYHTFLQESFSLLAAKNATWVAFRAGYSFQSVAVQFVKLFLVLVVWMAISGLSTEASVPDQES